MSFFSSMQYLSYLVYVVANNVITNIYLGCHVEERLHCSKNYEYIFNYISICSSKEQQSYKQYII